MRLRHRGQEAAVAYDAYATGGAHESRPDRRAGLPARAGLQAQLVSRSLTDADQSAQLIARIGIQPRLTPNDLRDGLSAAGVRSLDNQLRARSVTQDLARIKIWNTKDQVIYSDDHSLIGRTLTPSDDLLSALAGRPDDAEVVTPSPHAETASEVGLGQLVEVYVPSAFLGLRAAGRSV